MKMGSNDEEEASSDHRELVGMTEVVLMMMMMMMFRVSPSLGPHPPLHRFSPSSSTRSSSFSTLYSFFSPLLRLIQTFSIYLSSFDRSIHSIQFSPPSDFDSDSGSDFGSGFPYSSLLIRSSLDRWGGCIDDKLFVKNSEPFYRSIRSPNRNLGYPDSYLHRSILSFCWSYSIRSIASSVHPTQSHPLRLWLSLRLWLIDPLPLFPRSRPQPPNRTSCRRRTRRPIRRFPCAPTDLEFDLGIIIIHHLPTYDRAYQT